MNFEVNQECFPLVGGSTAGTGSTVTTPQTARPTRAPTSRPASQPAPSSANSGPFCSVCGNGFDVGAPNKLLETKADMFYTCDMYDEQVYGTSSQATCEAWAANGNTEFAQHFCECPNIIECRLCPDGETVGTPRDIILFDGGSWNATCAQIEMDFLFFSEETCQATDPQLATLCECSGAVSARSGQKEAALPLDKTLHTPLLGEKLRSASISGVVKSTSPKKLRGKGPHGDPSMSAFP